MTKIMPGLLMVCNYVGVVDKGPLVSLGTLRQSLEGELGRIGVQKVSSEFRVEGM